MVHLSAHFRLILIDLPGHGRSMPLYQGEQLKGLAERVAALAPSPAFWLGWSLGGLIALQIAMDYPAQVRKLVLVASTPRFTTAPDWPQAVVPELLSSFSQALKIDIPGTLKRFTLLQTQGSEWAKEVARTLFAQMNICYPSATGLQESLSILQNSDLRSALAAVYCPTLMIMGQQDILIPASVGEWMANQLFQGQICAVAGAGHAPFLSHPQVFLDALKAFLEV
ncbi:carboxylesterase of pimeloyl-CoA synthesis bioH [Candidatus Nitrosoglobus terrae]|uniref:Carboxylesterase of pimeloyl-CoA synthesis bioH n=2 Tax=Candidatus Nitrosoglobus terrae TaxID=1630141 RepID=A0A1Q2SLI3_9GAMM|nr:carboxylesterase of pimeloyl-CoA synthesis bioH [Candidatus Nitrosoglobus terrae]